MQLFSCTLNLVDNAVQPSGYRAALQSKLCADIHLRDCIQQIHFRNLGILYAKAASRIKPSHSERVNPVSLMDARTLAFAIFLSSGSGPLDLCHSQVLAGCG